MAEERDDTKPVYMIGVAARLAGMHPQTLRMYERKHLLRPKRTGGKTRLYSERDIATLRLIQELTREHGINLAGVRMIMELRRQIEQMEEMVSELGREFEQRRSDLLDEIERVHRLYRRELVLLPKGGLERARR